MNFSEKILDWYQENKRELPWRTTRDPYKIWLSEIMLQQTRVAQGLPYYKKFVTAFPTVHELAAASEEEILRLWQGLGYYSRARNMHFTAKQIVNKYQGKFPSSYKELLKLKGVGDYTASAIASICFDEKVAVVDGNVFRVLARYFGVDLPINSTKGVKHFKQLANELIDTDNIRDYNQGIMEFGAIQCSPKKPLCLHCPLNESCVALQKGTIAELPKKIKKGKVKIRYFNYLVPIFGNGHTVLEKRKGKGIWQNLYQFPLIESEAELNLKELRQRLPEALKSAKNVSIFNEDLIVHKLSHQHLHTRFWILEINKLAMKTIPKNELDKYPVPVLISDFLDTFKF